MSINYIRSGVNYNLLDPIKKMAQMEGLKTFKNLQDSGFSELFVSRGESAYLIEGDDCLFAFVQEGLGSKNLVADEMEKITGKNYYDSIAQDTVAAIINDLITTGAKPLSILAYWATGNSNWFNNKKRGTSLVSGWKKACDLAGCSWGGGETPTLKDIVYPNTIDLAGSAFGIIKPKNRLAASNKLKKGDVMIFLISSGIHANGLTLTRQIASNLEKGYKTKLNNGKTFGEELLTPTLIYSKLIQELLNNKIDIHYLVNITGHGWRKLMRARQSFSYIIDDPGEVPEIFKFIKKNAKLTDKEMYATFNMGAGFAIFVNRQEAAKVIKIANKCKINAWLAGKVMEGIKEVIIKPLNITYKEKELNIR